MNYILRCYLFHHAEELLARYDREPNNNQPLYLLFHTKADMLRWKQKYDDDIFNVMMYKHIS
jgi:hypothetical protein